MNLHELRVLVTGAASGLGRHFTERLLDAGATVAALDLAPDPLAQLVRDRAGDADRLRTWTADVSSEADVIRVVDEATAWTGGLNGLVNNAGLFRDALLVRKDRDSGAIRTMSLADWQRVIDVDLTGPFLLTREFAARVVERGGGPAVVVNISSVARRGNPGQSNYSAAKAGLVADTTLWARELARWGVRVGAIAPGFIDTPILRNMRPDALQKMMAGVPLGRAGLPEEIWLGAKFIFECDYFTGRCIDIDGGITM